MSESRDTAPDDDGEWAVSLADLEDDDEERAYEPAPIEPGDPSLEGAAFVALGIALTLVVLLGI